jgi:hypothetical protein
MSVVSAKPLGLVSTAAQTAAIYLPHHVTEIKVQLGGSASKNLETQQSAE